MNVDRLYRSYFGFGGFRFHVFDIIDMVEFAFLFIDKMKRNSAGIVSHIEYKEGEVTIHL